MVLSRWRVHSGLVDSAGRPAYAHIHTHLTSCTVTNRAAAIAAVPRPWQEAAALRQQLDSKWLPRKGETVFVPRLKANAKVMAVDKAKSVITLQAGMIKLTARADEVRKQ